jgi:lysophospholipase
MYVPSSCYIQSLCSNNKPSSDTSVTDLWGRAVSYHFLNETTLANFFNNDTAHGAGQLWSQLTQTAMYQQFQVPFPIIYANSRQVGSDDTDFLPLNSTVYEVKPF